jgi:hypothetical protein
MHRIATRPEHVEQLARAAAGLAPIHNWSHIAGEYLALASSITEGQRVSS